MSVSDKVKGLLALCGKKQVDMAASFGMRLRNSAAANWRLLCQTVSRSSLMLRKKKRPRANERPRPRSRLNACYVYPRRCAS